MALPVQRQVVLPIGKAVEIAYQSIRLRLSRSLLVTSGIVLALAFLTSILVTDRVVEAMRRWAGDYPTSAEFRRVRDERDRVRRDEFGPVDAELHKAAGGGVKPPEGAPKFDAAAAFGDDLPDLQKAVGVPLPAGEGELTALFTATPASVGTMTRWVAAARKLRALNEQLVAPQRLQQAMKENGVPSTPAEIAGNNLQTRWLVGLALLVAFVGILNAMLMSVTERFREIGTMKCLGALDSFIIKLFLIESLFQGLVGTAVGVVLGVGLSLGNLASSYGGPAWRNVPWAGLLGAAAFAAVVGVVLTVAGAVYPAWQAARMQPIEAMRVDA